MVDGKLAQRILAAWSGSRVELKMELSRFTAGCMHATDAAHTSQGNAAARVLRVRLRVCAAAGSDHHSTYRHALGGE